jgi:hypothetical protein
MAAPVKTVAMTRTPQQPGASNYEAQGGGKSPVQYYEMRYTTTGPQEWIIAPDNGRWAVALYFFGGGGSAWLEGSDEGQADLLGVYPGGGSGPPVFQAGHTYPITDPVTDTTRVIVEACAAVRVNVIGGTVDVTARC